MWQRILLIFSIILLLNSCDDENISADDIAELIEGNWLVEETSSFQKSTNRSTYTVQISINPDYESEFLISNFYQTGNDITVKGQIINSKLILDPNQEISDGFGLIVILEGSGHLSNNKMEISWTYKIKSRDGLIDNVSALYNRAY